jgi:hypothetical protein
MYDETHTDGGDPPEELGHARPSLVSLVAEIPRLETLMEHPDGRGATGIVHAAWSVPVLPGRTRPAAVCGLAPDVLLHGMIAPEHDGPDPWEHPDCELCVDVVTVLEAARPAPDVLIVDDTAKCPRCGAADSIVEQDAAARDNPITFERENGQLFGTVHQGDSASWETQAYACTNCARRVSIPLAVQIEWA